MNNNSDPSDQPAPSDQPTQHIQPPPSGQQFVISTLQSGQLASSQIATSNSTRLAPNSFSGMTTRPLYSVSAIKLDGTNFPAWKFHLRQVFANRGIEKVVYQGAETDEERVKDAEARELISSALEPKIINQILTCNTSHAMWSRLVSIYELKGEGNIELLVSKFHSLTMKSNETVSCYIGRVEELVSEIRGCGEALSDRQIRARIVSGLSSKFDGFYRVWNATTSAEKTLNNLIDRLIQDEAELNKSEKKRDNKGTAFVSTTSNRPTSSEYLKKPRDKRKDKCNYCKKLGHWERECRKKKFDLSNNSRNKTPGQKKDKNPNSGAQVALMARHDDEDNDSWYADSGASSHMVKNAFLFESYEDFEYDHDITLGNGSKLQAKGQGTIKFVSCLPNGRTIVFYLKNVKYVPGITTNLVSVGEAALNGANVAFEGCECTFLYNKHAIIKGHKSKINGLFKLNIEPQINGTAMIIKENRNLEEWHRTLAHIDSKRISDMAKNKIVDGINVVEKEISKPECGSCPLGKGVQSSHPPSKRERATVVGQVVHADLVGPSAVTSIGGNKYMLLLTDEASTFRKAYFLKGKNEVADNIQDYVSCIESETGHKLRRLCTDQGSEFVNDKVKTILDLEHAVLTTSTAYTPEQNGIAERSNRTVIEAARTLLVTSKLSEGLWAEAVNSAIYILNRTTNSVQKYKTPFELWYNRKPNIAHIQEFGREIHVLEKPRKSSKWSPKTILGYLVGFTERSNTYRCYLPKSDNVIVSCDVIFRSHPKANSATTISNQGEVSDTIEDQLIFPIRFADDRPCDIEEVDMVREQSCENHESDRLCDKEHESNAYLNQSDDSIGTTLTNILDTSENNMPEIFSTPDNNEIDHSNDHLETLHAAEPSNQCDNQAATSNSEIIDNPESGESSQNQIVPPRELNTTFTIRPADQRQRFERLQDHWKSTRGISGFLRLNMAYEEPRTYKEAIESGEEKHWRDAIKTEIRSLEDNDTWCVAALPKDKKALTARWVFKKKLLPSGAVDKYKARLVARGYTQRYGIDYDEVYAPVARYETIRCLLAIVSYRQLKTLQFDIETAFLNGILEEEIYMLAPDGIDCPQDKVLRLNKSLYGLKQSPKCWKIRFDGILKGLGLVSTYSDPCLYKGTFLDEFVMIVVYVDDGLIAALTREVMEKLITEIAKHVKIRKVESKFFVGFEIERERDGSVIIHQKSYIRNMIKNFNLEKCTPSKTPIGDINTLVQQEEKDEPCTAPYQEIIGSLNYAACLCRPDITFAVSLLSRFNRAPMIKHWEAAKRVLKYLSGTIDYGIKFDTNQPLELIAYSDADWANDKTTRKSVSGIIILLAGGPVIFRSKTQSLVALSSTEAEYIAASLAVRDITWLKGLLGELDIKPKRNSLCIDNQSAIKLIKTPTFQARSKHIDIRMHHIRDSYKKGEFEIVNVDTTEQQADILTKSLPAQIHLKMLNKICFVFLTCILMATSPVKSDFNVEDLVIWRPTIIKHIRGQTDLDLNLMFHNPCTSLFNNLTNVPRIDFMIVEICKKRYNSYVREEMNSLCPPLTNRPARSVALLTISIAAVSAIIASGFFTLGDVSSSHRVRDIAALTKELDDEIRALKYTILISNDKISDKINQLERDVEFIAATLQAQPEISDTLSYIVQQFREVHLKLRAIKKHLITETSVPAQLLELFNITELATDATLQHSMIHRCYRTEQDQVKLQLSLLMFSEKVKILRADPFSYWSLKNGKLCKFVYQGPEYILYNQTSNCFNPLLTGEITDNILLGGGCEFRKPKLIANNTYGVDTCQNIGEEDFKLSPVQIKHSGQFVHINCQGRFITIEGIKSPCPNHIFTLKEGKSFVIDDYHYHHEATNITRPLLDYSIPNKINLMMDTAHTQFTSLTAEEVEHLQNRAASGKRAELTEILNEKPSWIATFISKVIALVDMCGETIAVLILFFLVILYFRGRRNRPEVIHLSSLLLLIGAVAAAEHLIIIESTANSATKEIQAHQEYIKTNWCNEYRFYDTPENFKSLSGYYPQTLACSLSFRNYTCPCPPTPEWIPIVGHNSVANLQTFRTKDCPPVNNNSKLQQQEIEQLDIITQQLCITSKDQRWTESLGTLISSACLLARKMYNCACTELTNHKQVIYDPMTLKMTQALIESMMSNAKRCEEMEPKVQTTRPSVFEKFHQTPVTVNEGGGPKW